MNILLSWLCAVAYTALFLTLERGGFTISTHAWGLGDRAHSQMGGWGYMPGMPNSALNAWILLVAFPFLIFTCSVFQLILHKYAEADKCWLSSLQWNNRWEETYFYSWIGPSFAKWSGFSFWPGSSKCTHEILMPVMFTTLLGRLMWK